MRVLRVKSEVAVVVPSGEMSAGSVERSFFTSTRLVCELGPVPQA